MSWKEEIKKEKSTTVEDSSKLGEFLESAGDITKTIHDNNEKSFELHLKMQNELKFFLEETYKKSPDKHRHLLSPMVDLDISSRELHSALDKVTEITDNIEKILVEKLGKARRR